MKLNVALSLWERGSNHVVGDETNVIICGQKINWTHEPTIRTIHLTVGTPSTASSSWRCPACFSMVAKIRGEILNKLLGGWPKCSTHKNTWNPRKISPHIYPAAQRPPPPHLWLYYRWKNHLIPFSTQSRITIYHHLRFILYLQDMMEVKVRR